MDDKQAWLTVSLKTDMKNRIIKAAAHNSMSVSEYMRVATTTYMRRTGEWTLTGPKKGNG